MKKILILLTIALATSCVKIDSDYTKLEITSQVNDGEMNKQVLEGTFTKKKVDELGLVEITDADNRVKISYYEETPLKFFNLKIGTAAPIEWRKSKGHDLFLIQQTDSLGIIFGDRNSAAGKVKGSILFIK